MAQQATGWFGMRVTENQKKKIKHLAHKRGLSQKDAVMRAVEKDLGSEEPKEKVVAQPGSILEGLEHLVGSIEGPPDLSYNKKYLDDLGMSSLSPEQRRHYQK